MVDPLRPRAACSSSSTTRTRSTAARVGGTWSCRTTTTWGEGKEGKEDKVDKVDKGSKDGKEGPDVATLYPCARRSLAPRAMAPASGPEIRQSWKLATSTATWGGE